MITIGPDGKMPALRQVLNPGNFARILTVWFDRDLHVLRTQSGPDTDAPEMRGGPS